MAEAPDAARMPPFDGSRSGWGSASPATKRAMLKPIPPGQRPLADGFARREPPETAARFLAVRFPGRRRARGRGGGGGRGFDARGLGPVKEEPEDQRHG